MANLNTYVKEEYELLIKTLMAVVNLNVTMQKNQSNITDIARPISALIVKLTEDLGNLSSSGYSTSDAELAARLAHKGFTLAELNLIVGLINNSAKKLEEEINIQVPTSAAEYRRIDAEWRRDVANRITLSIEAEHRNSFSNKDAVRLLTLVSVNN